MHSSKTHCNCAGRVPRKNTWLIGIVNTMKCRRIVNMKSTTLRYTDNYTDMHHITVHWQLRRTCTTTPIHVNFTVSGIRWRRIANAKSQTARHTYTLTLATAQDMYSITTHRNCAGCVPQKNTWLIGIVNTMRWRRIANVKSTTLRNTGNYTRHVPYVDNCEEHVSYCDMPTTA